MSESEITQPVKLVIDAPSGTLGGSNGRYEKHLADLVGLYQDTAAFDELMKTDDGEPVYWVEQTRTQEGEGALITGLSVLEPGLVGDEYVMTRGHIHATPAYGELYHCLHGHGLLLLETLEGESQAVELHAGEAVYVPGHWVHRSVNVGDERFVTLFCYGTEAGQNYGVIGDAGGMKSIVVRAQGGGWELVANPRHSGYETDTKQK